MARRKLSPHFRAIEFDCRDGTPWPSAVRDDLKALAYQYLEPLRTRFGVVLLTSAYRHEAYNEDIGGAPDSRHIYRPVPGRGVAVDAVAQRGRPRDWYEFLDRLDAPGLGLYSWGVHVDNRRGRARW